MKNELQEIYDIIESALTMAGYEVIGQPYAGLKVFGTNAVDGFNYSIDIAAEAK